MQRLVWVAVGIGLAGWLAARKKGEGISAWAVVEPASARSSGGATFERQPDAPGFAPPAPFPLSHLIESLDQGRPPIASIREARDAFVAAMAAYESARLGKAVTIGSATARLFNTVE